MANSIQINSGVYAIINKLNNKVYIGSAINITKRFREHKSALIGNRHYNNYLQKSWNKYGENNFEFKTIEFCDSENLIEKEQYYIDKYISYESNNGYNITPKAGKIFHTKEICEKIRKSKIGHMVSKESRDKISKTLTGKYKKEEHPNFGLKFTDEHKNNISLSKKGNKLSKEHKKAISLAHKGKHIGENNCMYGKPSFRRKKILCIELNKEFESITEATKYILHSYSKNVFISVALNNPNKTSGNYHWSTI